MATNKPTRPAHLPNSRQPGLNYYVRVLSVCGYLRRIFRLRLLLFTFLASADPTEQSICFYWNFLLASEQHSLAPAYCQFEQGTFVSSADMTCRTAGATRRMSDAWPNICYGSQSIALCLNCFSFAFYYLFPVVGPKQLPCLTACQNLCCKMLELVQN